MATMEDVARLAGVSRLTASRVFNNATTVKASTCKAVLEAAAQLKYEPNAYAQRLASGGEPTIGLVMSHVADASYGAIITAVEREARHRKYRTLHACSYYDTIKEAEILRQFRALRVSGIIALPVMASDNTALWKTLEEEVPLVFANQFIPGCRHRIICDNAHGGCLATEHLLEQGRIPVCMGPHPLHPSQVLPERQRGYEQAMHAARLEPTILSTLPEEVDLHHEAFGYRVMANWLREHHAPEALYCVSDAMAVGAMHALREVGAIPGEDVLVCGHGNQSYAPYVSPPLTSVDIPEEALGAQAVEMLDGLICSEANMPRPKRRVLPCQLLIRQSTQGQMRVPKNRRTQ